MKILKSFTAALVGASALVATGSAALADGHLKEITVAYFLEWPTPNQFAQTNKMYEEALGVKSTGYLLMPVRPCLQPWLPETFTSPSHRA